MDRYRSGTRWGVGVCVWIRVWVVWVVRILRTTGMVRVGI